MSAGSPIGAVVTARWTSQAGLIGSLSVKSQWAVDDATTIVQVETGWARSAVSWILVDATLTGAVTWNAALTGCIAVHTLRTVDSTNTAIKEVWGYTHQTVCESLTLLAVYRTS